MLVGGLSDRGFARMARYADGYVHGSGPPGHLPVLPTKLERPGSMLDAPADHNSGRRDTSRLAMSI